MNRTELLDLYFLDARAKVIDLAAFLDRVGRAEGEFDFRFQSLKNALAELQSEEAGRARRVLLKLSDPSTEPVEKAATKSACGAWSEKN